MSASKEQRLLVIEGDLVRLTRTTVEREVKTSDFIQEIAKQQPLDSGILPRGCVCVVRRSPAPNRVTTVFVIEQPQGQQIVHFQPEKGNDASLKELCLSWPNALWFVRCTNELIHELYLAFSHSPIAMDGRDCKIHCPLLPNIYENGHGAFCLGNLCPGDQHSLPARIERLIQQVLDSTWNMDLMPCFGETGIEGLEDWAAKSASDVKFASKIRFPPHTHETVGGLLDVLLHSKQ